MPERTADLVALMPFARHIGMTIDEASAGQVVALVAQTTQVQSVITRTTA